MPIGLTVALAAAPGRAQPAPPGRISQRLHGWVCASADDAMRLM
jgi:hypothetical protein